jgi:hypothetical protein
VLANQGFDVVEAGPARCADAQAALVDGQADGSPLAAAQLIGNRLVADDQAADNFRYGWRHPGSGAARCGAFHFDPRFGLLVDLGFGHAGGVEGRADADGDGARLLQEGLARPVFTGIVGNRHHLQPTCVAR